MRYKTSVNLYVVRGSCTVLLIFWNTVLVLIWGLSEIQVLDQGYRCNFKLQDLVWFWGSFVHHRCIHVTIWMQLDKGTGNITSTVIRYMTVQVWELRIADAIRLMFVLEAFVKIIIPGIDLKGCWFQVRSQFSQETFTRESMDRIRCKKTISRESMPLDSYPFLPSLNCLYIVGGL